MGKTISICLIALLVAGCSIPGYQVDAVVEQCKPHGGVYSMWPDLMGVDRLELIGMCNDGPTKTNESSTLPREKFDTGMFLTSVGAAFYFVSDNEILIDSGYSNTLATVDIEGGIFGQGRKIGRLYT